MAINKKKSLFIESITEKTILLVVFLTGACVLILEVLATRILSPYFGNTIFTVSSVIGVVLAALSLGYYFGGMCSDKYPHKNVFYLIILISGLFTFIMQIFITFLLPYWGYKLPVTYGPLVTSIVLFSIPSLLLGMLSPYAIKLQELQFPNAGVGKLSGQVFFFSTLGSILGTFLAGFYLIPKYGLDLIILGVGSMLVMIGIFGVLTTSKASRAWSMSTLVSRAWPMSTLVKKKSTEIVVILIVTLILFFAATLKFVSSSDVIYSKDGRYEKITIKDAVYKGKPSRILLQDRSASSALFYENPLDLAFEYTKYINLYKITGNPPKRALFIGGGAYSMPNYLIRNLPEIQIDVTEIEPDLYKTAQKYFWFESNNRLINHVEDGRRFLHDNNMKYDLIFSDVYSTLFSIPAHFTTIEFFELSKNNLSENGIFIANIIGDLSRQNLSLTFSEINTFRKVFPNSYIFTVDSTTNRRVQNLIYLGLKSDKTLNLDLLAKNYSTDEILIGLKDKLINLDRFDLSNYSVLTDNYSPVESITKSLIERSLENQSEFNGKEALSVVRQIVSYGSRHVGSLGHDKVLKMLASELQAYDKNFIDETWDENINNKNYRMSNFSLNLYPEKKDRIILATHYDSLSENPGANNSASGVAVLLEIMRALKNSPGSPNVGIDFVFFDGEEGIPGQDWKAYGSEHFAKNIRKIYKNNPVSALMLDMVCDKDLEIFFEKNSLEKATKETMKFFVLANNLYPNNFHKEAKYSIADDHTALNNIGIPSTLLIDFDYPYYNTQKDSLDKCSSASLEKVGKSILKYIYSL